MALLSTGALVPSLSDRDTEVGNLREYASDRRVHLISAFDCDVWISLRDAERVLREDLNLFVASEVTVKDTSKDWCVICTQIEVYHESPLLRGLQDPRYINTP